MLLYISYSRFSIMLSYSSNRLGNMWVIISKSSIIPIFINCLSIVIVLWSSLMDHLWHHLTRLFNFFHSLVLCTPITGLNFLFNFSYARKCFPLGKPSVTNYSLIWKHTALSCAKIRAFYVFLFIWLSIVYYLLLSSALYTKVLTLILKVISYPSYTSLDNNLFYHIHHVLISSSKGEIMILVSSVLFDLPWLWSFDIPLSYFEICFSYLFTSNILDI